MTSVLKLSAVNEKGTSGSAHRNCGNGGIFHSNGERDGMHDELWKRSAERFNRLKLKDTFLCGGLFLEQEPAFINLS